MKVKLCLTDTDSLLYSITNCDDIYSVMQSHPERFDTSNYPKYHKCYSSANAKVTGFWKDELGLQTMYSFCGLRSKMYAFTFQNRLSETESQADVKKLAKDVLRNIVRQKLTFEHYKNYLFNKSLHYENFN